MDGTNPLRDWLSDNVMQNDERYTDLLSILTSLKSTGKAELPTSGYF